MKTIALIGNPNCGKTTLFNAVTGAHQKVGNWPGVTVERKSGSFRFGSVDYELVDLPGVYSLEQSYAGLDEQIARDFIEEGDADLIINIVDASNLERNLVLTQQLLETGVPVVVALNMLDVAERNGAHIDVELLAGSLGTAAVPIVASRGRGVADLLAAVAAAFATVQPAEDREKVEHSADIDERLVQRYHRARTLVDGAVEVVPVTHTLSERIDALVLHRLLGIPVFLLVMYLMFTIAINLGAVFINFFDILFNAFLVEGSRLALEGVGAPEFLIVLLSDGLGGGITLVATFIPVVGFLFLTLAVIEDSGYMARAGFVIDRLMARIGLPGSAFVPLIVGFGCNVPSVMATRALGREQDRLLTIAMAPFMSCGARLTVYALFAAAFFPSGGQNIVFLLYLLGIVLAIGTGWVFRRQIFDKAHAPSIQEMPAYHLPVLRNVLFTTWFRLRGFVFRAGKTIVVVVMCLSFLSSIGSDGSFGNQDSDTSVLAAIGKTITPVFAPIGVREENWPATVGLFTGLFAKEAVVGTLDALYSVPADSGAERSWTPGSALTEALGSIAEELAGLSGALTDPLGLDIGDTSDPLAAAEAQGVADATLTRMASLFGTQLAAFSYLVFVLIYAPCVAVLGAAAKESGWRWTALIFAWTTGLAYVTASVIYQLGTFGEHPLFSAGWIVGCVLVMIFAIRGLRRVGRAASRTELIPVAQVGA